MLLRQFSALLGLCAIASVGFAAQDEVVVKTPRGEETIRGEIKEESAQRFRMVEANGQPMPDFTGDQIVSVRWDIQDFEFLHAKGEYDKGQYEAAAVSLKAFLDSGNARKATVAYLEYLCGDSYRRANKPAEAEAVLEKMIEQHVQSWYCSDAIDKLVDVCAMSGNFQKMTPLLAKLRGLPGDKYKAKASMYEGQMLVQTNKIDEAMRKFTEAAGLTSDPEAKGEAQMLLAGCYVKKKDYENARKTAERAITQNTPEGVLASAHLVIGNALFQQGMEAKGDQAQELFLDAVLEYLRVWTLYPGNERVEGEALFQAGESFKFLSRLPGRRSDRRRAAEMYAQVSRKFPGSLWAKKASQAIQEVQ